MRRAGAAGAPASPIRPELIHQLKTTLGLIACILGSKSQAPQGQQLLCLRAQTFAATPRQTADALQCNTTYTQHMIVAAYLVGTPHQTQLLCQFLLNPNRTLRDIAAVTAVSGKKIVVIGTTTNIYKLPP